MSMQKRNGTDDLIARMNEAGWFAVAPVTTRRSTPDVLAANGNVTFSIVAESTDGRKATFSTERVEAAETLASAVCGTTLAAIRFDRADTVGKWRFLNTRYLDGPDGGRLTQSASDLADKVPMAISDLPTARGGPLHSE